MNKQIDLIKAPSILGLRATGVELLPDSLLKADLLKNMTSRNSRIIPSLSYNSHRDPQTLMLNPHAIAAYSVVLANAVQEVVQTGHVPFVLGGDCSIILGNMLALKRIGQYGLFFMDGHADFYQPEASLTGEAADMDLAIVSGRGPEIVTNLEGQKPLVNDEHIVVFGQRDQEETVNYGSQQLSATSIHQFSWETINRTGITQSTNDALQALLQNPIRGLWIHIDADVLNDSVMPSVDYLMPGGLSFEDLSNALSMLLSSGKATGLNLGIFNPRLDPDGEIASRLAMSITNGFKNAQ